MDEVYVTITSCSECVRQHPDGDSNPLCDCWCHDGDDWFEVGDANAGTIDG